MIETRALSTALGYTLTLAITAVLVSGLLISGGSFVEDQRERVIQTELEVVGEQLATHLNAADRLNQSAAGPLSDRTISIRQPFPADVAGTPYRVTLVEQSDPVLRLETSDAEISTEVELTNTTAMAQSRASGGTVVIEYNTTEEAVVIDDV
jgi:hypothetical protein